MTSFFCGVLNESKDQNSDAYVVGVRDCKRGRYSVGGGETYSAGVHSSRGAARTGDAFWDSSTCHISTRGRRES